ncbi:chondroitinase-B domain-containing protein [Seonamhaeicola maritimus]|uniref:chondroitinase-B domain-containing protein n=1 Tax=Seonamhaeicola maritimus TaxID=2591822 RepID=UPI0024958727|nr:chondroitinase-B domain-containing protein [Seonamhaeicola maritimus]
MKKTFYLLTVTFLLLSCNLASKPEQNSLLVRNIDELNNFINKAAPGDVIVLANGIWKDVQIEFYGNGSKNKPITLKAETPGKVFIEGTSFIHLGGNHLIVEGLYFRNGYSPSTSIIRFKIGDNKTAFNSRVTSCVIKNFTKPNRLTNDKWIEFYGKHNTLNHCYISGKSNDGETLRVFQDGNEHSSNHHQIVNNYFGPRPRKGGPRAETIRFGDSKTSMSSGFVNVSNNYFEACNGEVEIISDKTNYNTFKNNIFYKSEGSLVLRHGNFTTVDSNIFIGGDDSNFYGGIRVVSSGHWITNNYFYKIKGEEFRSPLAIMNGIPMSPLNRYKQVTDIVVAYNTWVDCKSPWQIGVGQNIKSMNVLPKYEIRSAPPIRSIIANNLIFNHKSDDEPFVNHDNFEGILFKNNVLDNSGKTFTKYGVFENNTVKMKQINSWLFAPEFPQPILTDSIYFGYEFDKIKTDLLGVSRIQNSIGAISNFDRAEKFVINKNLYGPDWFSPEQRTISPKIFKTSAKNNELIQNIAEANSGDIIELTDNLYAIDNSIAIKKDITIRSKNNAQIIFKNPQETPLFEMHPYSFMHLDSVILKGKNNQLVFKPLDKNMSAAYNIDVKNSTIEGFGYILKAPKGSFTDILKFENSLIKHCNNGIVLAAEVKGDYNAEMVTITNCKFENVSNNVVNFFRGGYDESTIGGILSINNSTFSNCGKFEENGVLLKTKGIINVDLTNNTFQNNPVKYVAVLWGAKNNIHKENILINSGEIKVEEQQKLEILY